MRDRTEFGRSSRSRKISVLPVFLTLLLVASLVAQKTPKPSPPKYDLQTEVKIKGPIEEVKLPPKGSEKEIVHLLVKGVAAKIVRGCEYKLGEERLIEEPYVLDIYFAEETSIGDILKVFDHFSTSVHLGPGLSGQKSRSARRTEDSAVQNRHMGHMDDLRFD